MTTLDHLRAVLATVNDKAHATEEVQSVLEAARAHASIASDHSQRHADWLAMYEWVER